LLTLDGKVFEQPELSDFDLALTEFIKMALPVSNNTPPEIQS